MAVVRAVLLGLAILVILAVVVPAARVCRPGGRVSRALTPFFCRVLLRILRVRVVPSGRLETVEPVLLVANHVSWIDPIVFGATKPFTMLAKQEVGTWPGIASFARLQQSVLVDRTRRMQVPSVNRALAARLAAGRSILFFPEGTTHDGKRRGRFLTSHFACLASSAAGNQPSAQAQAAALSYSDDNAAWIGDMTLLPHLWSVLRRPGMICRVSFGAPRSVAVGYDRKRLARTLADDVETLLERQFAPVPMPYESSQNSPAESAIVAGRVRSQAAPTCHSVAG